MQRTPLVAPIVGALLLGLGATACSTQERNYDIPSTLCGTTISPDILESLLPPGEEISMENSSIVKGVKRCHVSVDGEDLLSASIDWQDKERSAPDVASFFPGVGPGDKKTDDGRYLYPDTGAIGEVVCPKPRKPDSKLFVTVRVNQDNAPGGAAMKEFITSYAEAVGKSNECT